MAAQNSVGVNTSTVPSVPTIQPPQQPETPPVQQDQQQIQTELTSTTEENITPLVTGSSVVEEEEIEGTDYLSDEEYFEEPFTDDVIELPDPDPNVSDETLVDEEDKGVDIIPEDINIIVNTTSDKKAAIRQATQVTWGNSIDTKYFKQGVCAWYTFNHAYNYSRIILGLANKTTKKGSKNIVKPTNVTVSGGYRAFGSRRGPIYAAGGNAKDLGYWANLVNTCGYKSPSNYQPKTIKYSDLILLLKDTNKWNIGDVIIYWGGNTTKNSFIYGHTQIFTGGYQFPLSNKYKTNCLWVTDVPDNYKGSYIVYSGSPNSIWNYIILRAPEPSKSV